ncbi:hypothetical protein [Streptomyces sp. NPDC005423]|uniref:hypothetical protein n=1 Tax=Streptomyces sp. NPDC005423 TaxID=3155343 RepID=UPI0033B0136F
MPDSVRVALVLVHTLFAVTVVGGLGLLATAASYGVLDGETVGLVAYGAAPGVLGWWLARRSWEGGVRVRRGLVAVQVWSVVGALAHVAAGSARGGTQLLLPVLVLCFVLRPESREWYGLPVLDRVERRPFSLARLVRPGHDGGQTSVEYLGFVAIVVALVTALLVGGLGPRIFDGIRSEVCKVTGAGCPAPARGGDGTDTTSVRDKGDGTPAVPVSAKKKDGGKDDGCFSGVGAFFGCAGDQVKQVGQGVGVDGVWGDLTGIYGLVRHPVDTVKGIGDYGKKLGTDWTKNSRGAAKKWADGDYGGALWDWGGASLKTGGTVVYDVFVGDDVADDWNHGQKTRAVSHVLWNVGSLFIPGYDVGKVVEKVGDLGKVGRLGKLGELAEKAAEAAERARKAAKAGDLAAAEKAAKDADDAAAEAEEKARKTGCTVSAPARRVPYGGGAGPVPGGATTTVLAAGASPYVVLAEDGCDEDAEKEAEDAREQADDADHAAGRMDKAEVEAAKRPTVGQGDPKKFKDHFLRHKKLVEDALGTKYKKLKEDGPRFLQDIQATIENGTFKLVGKGTLKKGEPEGLIYRGNGVTIVLRDNGDFWTALKTGEGLDTSIEITKRAE